MQHGVVVFSHLRLIIFKTLNLLTRNTIYYLYLLSWLSYIRSNKTLYEEINLLLRAPSVGKTLGEKRNHLVRINLHLMSLGGFYIGGFSKTPHLFLSGAGVNRK